MISEVFRPCGEHCLVFLMTEVPDFDFLAVGSLHSFAGIDEPFSVFRGPRHNLLPENGNAFVSDSFESAVAVPLITLHPRVRWGVDAYALVSDSFEPAVAVPLVTLHPRVLWRVDAYALVANSFESAVAVPLVTLHP